MPSNKFSIPQRWTRRGLILPRQMDEKVSSVSGDPCVVWDEEINGWRMVFFYSPPGHGQAVCLHRDDLGPGHWKLEGPLPITNPEALYGGFLHKPFLVLDPHRPNYAAKISGRYGLLGVTGRGTKLVQRAWSDRRRSRLSKDVPRQSLGTRNRI